MSGSLDQGIRFVDCNPLVAPAAPRVLLSAGTAPASRLFPEGPYRADAYIPCPPWRETTPRDEDVLLACGDQGNAANVVAIVKVPDSVLADVAVLRTANAVSCDRRHQKDVRLSADGLRGIQRVVAYASALTQYPIEAFRCAGIATQSPDQYTTTRDDKQQLIGLHVDSWYEYPLELRAFAPWRMSVNLGLGERAFYFINQPLAALSKAMCKFPSGARQPLSVGCGLGQAFMHSFPSYPVVRIRVSPGEAYIAPTENILHDGSTSGQTLPDVSLTVHGPFNGLHGGGRAHWSGGGLRMPGSNGARKPSS